MPSSPLSSPLPLFSLSLHDALPISAVRPAALCRTCGQDFVKVTLQADHSAPALPNDSFQSDENTGFITPKLHFEAEEDDDDQPKKKDRKSTRLNSSHGSISYAVFSSLFPSPALLPFPTRRSSDLGCSAGGTLPHMWPGFCKGYPTGGSLCARAA